jgi:hypothetical protein
MSQDQNQYVSKQQDMKAEKNCDTFSSKIWKATDNICYEKKGLSQVKNLLTV